MKLDFTLSIPDAKHEALDQLADLLYEAEFDDSHVSFSDGTLYIDCTVPELQYEIEHYLLDAVLRARSVLGDDVVVNIQYYDENDLISWECTGYE